MIAHIRRVFGGDYVVHPVPIQSLRIDVGSAALKDYNGLRGDHSPDRGPDDYDDILVTQPRGALSFYQLNTIAEGFWNDMLSPAVYFEQREFLQRYFNGDESRDFLRSIADVVEALTTDTDATSTLGQIVVLHHFLTVTADGPLLKLRSAVESVRRRLLDQTAGRLQGRELVQLGFNGGLERWPELAVNATDTQLKGYATLVEAKLPLIVGVLEVTRASTDFLEWVALRNGPRAVRSPAEDAELEEQLSRLRTQLYRWNGMVNDLEANVRSLGSAMEHAWMEQLLHEQQRARSDQEKMVDIERSRLSLSTNSSSRRTTYNIFALFTVVAVGVVLATGGLSPLMDAGVTWAAPDPNPGTSLGVGLTRVRHSTYRQLPRTGIARQAWP